MQDVVSPGFEEEIGGDWEEGVEGEEGGVMGAYPPIQNHPECNRWVLGVNGPRETRWKVIITKERTDWCWRYKRPNEFTYVFVGKVKHFDSLIKLCEEIRISEFVADLY